MDTFYSADPWKVHGSMEWQKIGIHTKCIVLLVWKYEDNLGCMFGDFLENKEKLQKKIVWMNRKRKQSKLHLTSII